ncbi:unnamed protein product [Didymodactylos carnosus]|uniref:Sugar phosphate transporter domain-containing protein n=1 Tax=Didymodactylos carnosus TaxID=1234261 RepID=A0A815S1C0_9BILA|nr:unnamed protein product [Didymodactylos carnosus]CAF1484137.1 unnamed protein product [Didymodactylos carnosus]CAF3511281.1 unnamed protein product [Didymodactylos carnosus]CAF4348527.1 unnamed protein product [Didymodactylos carnosus]
MLHLPSMLVYGLLSFSMAFLNKALFEVTGFKNSFFVILIQLAFLLVSFYVFKILNLVKLPPLTYLECKNFILPSLMYSLTTALSLKALIGLNVAVYVVVKRCTPAFTFILAAFVLKKQKFSLTLGLSVCAITTGAIITSAGDLKFDLISYIIGGLSVLAHALYLLLIQRCGEDKSSVDVLYINSVLSLPFIFILTLFSNEWTSVKNYNGYTTWTFWLFFLFSTMGGNLLNYSTFWCTMKNSALTTSVVGVLKSILQILFGIFTFERLDLNIYTIGGITLSLIGGTMFSYAEYHAKVNRNKRTPASMNNEISTQENNQQHQVDLENSADDNEKFVYIRKIHN